MAEWEGVRGRATQKIKIQNEKCKQTLAPRRARMGVRAKFSEFGACGQFKNQMAIVTVHKKTILNFELQFCFLLFAF